jgi:hypothetical protein
MFAFVTIFSLFNVCASVAGAGAGMRLLTAENKAAWASKRLYVIALAMAWGMAALGLGASAIAWALWPRDPRYALFTLVPALWLIAMGFIFAAVDFAEDGVFDFGRGPKRDQDRS